MEDAGFILGSYCLTFGPSRVRLADVRTAARCAPGARREKYWTWNIWNSPDDRTTVT